MRNSETEKIRALLKSGKLSQEQAERLQRAVSPSQDLARPLKKKSHAFLGLSVIVVVLFVVIIGLFMISRSQSLAMSHLNVPKDSLVELPQSSEVSRGQLLMESKKRQYALPLKHTRVQTVIQGLTARTHLTQTFINPLKKPIEAIYVFPLPELGVVDNCFLEVGNSRIRGRVQPLATAEQFFQTYKKKGSAAAMLTARRGNIYRQILSHIRPGDTVRVTLRITQLLEKGDGEARYSFPLTIGPRYISGQPIRPEPTGLVNPTDKVPDAHKISPPLITPKNIHRSSLSLNVEIHTDGVIQSLSSPSHRIRIQQPQPGQHRVQLQKSDALPNRDFVLQFKTSQTPMGAQLFSHKTAEGEGYFQLILDPKKKTADRHINRDLIILVDGSGSMKGEARKSAVRIVHALLKQTPASKTARIAHVGRTFETKALPKEEKARNVMLEQFLNRRTLGGTNMNLAFRQLLLEDKSDVDILLLSDGYIGNESALFATVQDLLGEARVYTMGIGYSVNRYFLRGLADVGKGRFCNLYDYTDEDRAVGRIKEMLDGPIIRDVSYEWNGIHVRDLAPSNISEIFNGDAMVLMGRYTGSNQFSVLIKGTDAAGHPFSRTVAAVPSVHQALQSFIPTLWASQRIHQLQVAGPKIFGGQSYLPKANRLAIEALGLEHGLVTPFTSMLALTEAIRNSTGEWVTVEQPLLMPESIDSLGLLSEWTDTIPAVHGIGDVGRGGDEALGRVLNPEQTRLTLADVLPNRNKKNNSCGRLSGCADIVWSGIQWSGNQAADLVGVRSALELLEPALQNIDIPAGVNTSLSFELHITPKGKVSDIRTQHDSGAMPKILKSIKTVFYQFRLSPFLIKGKGLLIVPVALKN